MRFQFAFLTMLLLSGSFAFAIKIESLAPANGAKEVCIDSQLAIQFDAVPAITGTGKLELLEDGKVIQSIDLAQKIATQSIGGLDKFNYHTSIVSDKTATFFLPHHTLQPSKTYEVRLDANTITDFEGVKESAWRFTTKASKEPKDPKKIIVSSSGEGDFATLQGAIDSIPDGSTNPTTITLKKGTYTEIVYFKNKHNITIAGEDRKSTIIQYANNNTFNKSGDGGVYRRGMFLAHNCNDLTITNLTFHNTTPRGGSQAEAIILKSGLDARMKIIGCDLISFQDTLQDNGQCYIEDCYIEGDVDFMWGSGPCYFENCRLVGTRSRAYYTQVRNTDKNHGFVYNHCTFEGTEGIERMVFGRIDPNTFPYSEVVILNSTIGKSLSDWGWLLSKEGDATKMRNWEYNNKTPEGNPVDTSKRAPHTKILNDKEDAEHIKNYSDPVWVLGGKWNPKLK